MYINEATLGTFILHADIRYELWKNGEEAPGVLTPEYLDSKGYKLVTVVPQEYNRVTEKLVAQPPAKNANGQWEIQQIVVPEEPAMVANHCTGYAITKMTPEITAILQPMDYYDRVVAEVEKRRIEQLWASASGLESSAISPTVAGLVTRGVLQSKPKCIAVQAWVNALWAEYYARKASGSNDMGFVPAVGLCPHTVPELVAELA